MGDRTKITALHNGPFLVKGPVYVTDAEGNELRAERATVALCRCGGSETKPFCDGTHSRLGFQAAERAVATRESVVGKEPSVWVARRGERITEYLEDGREGGRKW